MKIGIITDIHSNIQALNAVLNEFDKLKVDRIICCGDIIGIGINPEETVQKLISKREILIAVRGNHEQYLLNGLPEKVHDDKRNMSSDEIKNHERNHHKLSEQSKKFLNELDLSKYIEIEGKRIYLIHYPVKENGIYKKHMKNPNIIECEEMFKEIDADIFIYGHTHMSSINNAEDKWYINVGTLGCPKNSCIANAGLLEINAGKIKFTNVKVEYDVKEIIEEIKRQKFPYYEKILQIFYGI